MTVLSDHTLLLALPAFAPAVVVVGVVVGVVVFVAMRDRHEEAETSDDGSHSENSARDDHDGSP